MTNELQIYKWWNGDGTLDELKQWVDFQILEGKSKVKLDIDWGYYDDINELTLIAK